MFKRLGFFVFVLLMPAFVLGQIKYYENTFVGGVSGDGVSRPQGTMPLTLNIPAGSSVVKAFLFAGGYTVKTAPTITLNGSAVSLNAASQISPTFLAHQTYGGSAAVYAADVTSIVSGSVNTYSLSVNPSPMLSSKDILADFYLYAEYTHPTLTKTTYSAIFIQATDLDSSIYYNMSLSQPINTATDVGVALFGGFTTDNNLDSWNVFAEGNFLGKVGEITYNARGEGAMGSFYYHNNTLKGIKNDNEDLPMKDQDAVSNVKSIETNGSNLASMEFVHGNSGSPRDNAMWAVFYVNGVECIKPQFDLGQQIKTCANQVAIDAGISGYNYSWSTTATTQQVTVNSSGYYTVTVTDQNGCSQRDSVQVTLNSSPVVTLGASTTVCSSKLPLKLDAGNPGSTYLWNTTAITQAIQVSAGGIYSVVVTDAAGCTASGSIDITLVNDPVVSIGNQSLCVNKLPATLDAGNAGSTYLWSTGATTQTITTSASGGYTVTVTNASGCSATGASYLSTKGLPKLSNPYGITTSNCNGVISGTINIAAYNTTAPYTFSWSNGSTAVGPGPTEPVATSVTVSSGGTFTVVVTDANGCSVQTSVTITAPQSYSVTTSSTSTACGANTGTATVTVTGGKTPYSYNWSHTFINSATVSNLSAGNYTVLVSDGTACTKSVVIFVSNTSGATLTMDPHVDATCYNGYDGSASVTASGGTSPYNYSWSNFYTTNTTSYLTQGVYSVTVTDGVGCKTQQTVSITSPPDIVLNITATPLGCSGGGSASAAPTGGSGSGYTYSWSAGTQSSSTINGLSASAYTLQVTDSKGCTKTGTFSITGASGITMNVNVINPTSCSVSTGSATVNVSGGSSVYTYSWSTGSQSAASVSNINPGTYSVLVSDNSGCTNTASFTIDPFPNTVSLTTSAGQPTCKTPTANASVSAIGGSSSYTYSWDNNATTSLVTGLTSGSYVVVVTDTKGCTKSITAVVPPYVNSAHAYAGTDTTIDAGASVQLTGQGGLTYSWIPNTDLSCDTCKSTIATPDVTTSYTLVITDNNGCVNSDTITIYVETPCGGELFLPTAFSPNNDGVNDVFKVNGGCVYDLLFQVYSRWGELVFETKDIAKGWDGSFRGQAMNTGVFIYQVKGVLTTTGDKVYKKGNVTLVR